MLLRKALAEVERGRVLKLRTKLAAGVYLVMGAAKRLNILASVLFVFSPQWLNLEMAAAAADKGGGKQTQTSRGATAATAMRSVSIADNGGRFKYPSLSLPHLFCCGVLRKSAVRGCGVR